MTLQEFKAQWPAPRDVPEWVDHRLDECWKEAQQSIRANEPLASATTEDIAAELSKRHPAFLLLIQIVGENGIENMSVTYYGLYASIGMAQSYITRADWSLKQSQHSPCE